MIKAEKYMADNVAHHPKHENNINPVVVSIIMITKTLPVVIGFTDE
jgi:hypothetical protein